MSSETKDLNNHHYTSSYNNHYSINNQNIVSLPYVSCAATYSADMISSQVGFDLHSKNMSPLGAYEIGFELSPPSSEFFNPTIDQETGLYNAYNYDSSHKSHEIVGGTGGGATIESETRVSASPSSSEADHLLSEDSSKMQRKREAGDGEKEDQRSPKIVKTKNKEETKQKEPRVSFMTKTEVDHLEDGYRWRKYGQKAVKNSPYPRSYYRCTTQKCKVKKRVERSYQDPTVVITTYESQHNHPVPTNRRTTMFSVPDYNPPASSTNFADVISYTQRSFLHDDLFRAPYASVNVNPNYHHQQHQATNHESEYELLKEMFPSVFFKQET